MPITKWICAGCGGREVPLSHFQDSACGELVHPDYCAAIIKDRSAQYVTGAVRVSMGLGCPRKAAIEEAEEFAVDPLDLNAMSTGTAWHSFVEGDGGDGREVELGGTLAGVKVAGKCDRIRTLADGTVAIEDWKHVNDFGVKYIKDGPKPEHVVQVSLYAELIEQMGGQRPTVGMIWYHSSQAGRAAMTPHRFPLLPTYEALNHRPYGCDFTVADLFKQAAAHYEDGVRWQEMAMAGKSITFGAKTACDYCSVRSICWTTDKGAPF